MKTEYVPRVNQLDSIHLDDDITRIVRDQLSTALQGISPGLLTRYQPELDLLLRTAIWHRSVLRQHATFGQQLLFICYDPAQLRHSRLALHYVLTVALRYARDVAAFRGHLFGDGGGVGGWLQAAQQWTDNAATVAGLANFFRFLGTGKRPSVVDWVLRLDHITMHGQRRRDVGYTSMSRELIWGGFMELLGFTLPLINYHSVKRKLRNLVTFGGGGAAASRSDGSADAQLAPDMRLQTRCAYCSERPTLPHHMHCAHVFCYYCLQGNVMADASFQCPVCDRVAQAVEAV